MGLYTHAPFLFSLSMILAAFGASSLLVIVHREHSSSQVFVRIVVGNRAAMLVPYVEAVQGVPPRPQCPECKGGNGESETDGHSDGPQCDECVGRVIVLL